MNSRKAPIHCLRLSPNFIFRSNRLGILLGLSVHYSYNPLLPWVYLLVEGKTDVSVRGVHVPVSSQTLLLPSQSFQNSLFRLPDTKVDLSLALLVFHLQTTAIPIY